jgi:hypothetical protein
VVERNLAKVEVVGSSPISRSTLKTPPAEVSSAAVFFSLGPRRAAQCRSAQCRSAQCRSTQHAWTADGVAAPGSRARGRFPPKVEARRLPVGSHVQLHVWSRPSPLPIHDPRPTSGTPNRPPMIRSLATALAPLVLLLGLNACGGQEPYEKGIDAMEDFVEVLEGIESKEDVAKAKGKLEAITKRMQELENVSKDGKELPEEPKKEMAEVMGRMQKVMMSFAMKPEIMEELGPILEQIDAGK